MNAMKTTNIKHPEPCTNSIIVALLKATPKCLCTWNNDPMIDAKKSAMNNRIPRPIFFLYCAKPSTPYPIVCIAFQNFWTHGQT